MDVHESAKTPVDQKKKVFRIRGSFTSLDGSAVAVQTREALSLLWCVNNLENWDELLTLAGR